MRRITKPVLLPFWWQDLLLAIPRVVCGYLLTSSFGADKFGLPWSPADRNLGLFEIVFWFPEDVSNYGGIFAKFPVFFAWMAGFSEAVGSYDYDGCNFFAANSTRNVEYAACSWFFMG